MMDLQDKSIKDIKAYYKANEDKLVEDQGFIQNLKNDQRKALGELALQIEKKVLKKKAEIRRVKALYHHDFSFQKIVCGVDEVGRGPLAGPIVAAAVILKEGSSLEEMILGIDDSKKLSKKRREELDQEIRKKALCYSIYEMSNLDIDRLGISYCNHEVFRGAIRTLSVTPELVLSDGYLVKDYMGENRAIIKGDTKSASIACASIIAKVHRDKIMERLSVFYPVYGFESNVGYGSEMHIKAIKADGPTPIHRMSFLRNLFSKE